MSLRNGPHLQHYHNAIKSTNSAVYTPSSSIISEPLTNNYTVGENIGRGKFAVVKKCTNVQSGEVVAAKFIKKRRRGKSCREEILREVVMLEMALNHPRLVNLKEVYETQQELILITEYCAGGELFTECILEEKFNEADVRLLMSQILEGLVYLHEKNIVHLDLKPQNILLSDEFPRGSVKICDLGFACLVNTGEDIRDIIGTPDYVAPEVLNYDPLGLYTDMWSLGVLTYVMLTTCSPFADEDKQMTFSNITNVNFDFPDDLFADISVAAQDFIQKLLVAEPNKRMTARECFDHEWLAEISKPSLPLTICNSETSDLTPSEVKEDTEQVNDSEEENNLSEVTLSNEETSLHQPRENSRDKIEDQPSEMSVNETREDEGILLDTEPDIEGDTQVELSNNVCDEAGQEQNIRDIGISGKSIIHDEDFQTVRKESRINTSSAINASSSDVTPDTDSSMCISDSRLQDTDSGMFTGSECKSTESVNISGRTSVNQEPVCILDTDFNSETNDDIEMLNKSSIENEILDLKEGTVSVFTNILEKSEPKEADISEVSPENIGEIQEIISENEMDVEVSDSYKDSMTSVINENNSATEIKVEKRHSRLEDISSIQDEIYSSESSDKNTDSFKSETEDQVFNSVMSSPVYAPTQSQSDAKARNSVNNIDDSINSMELGERHKRGMCNDPVTSGTDTGEKDGEGYDYVCVSKRVRSYEDTIALSNSPPYSPKISRSPRIARHSRHHHQKH